MKYMHLRDHRTKLGTPDEILSQKSWNGYGKRALESAKMVGVSWLTNKSGPQRVWNMLWLEN